MLPAVSLSADRRVGRPPAHGDELAVGATAVARVHRVVDGAVRPGGLSSGPRIRRGDHRGGVARRHSALSRTAHGAVQHAPIRVSVRRARGGGARKIPRVRRRGLRRDGLEDDRLDRRAGAGPAPSLVGAAQRRGLNRRLPRGIFFVHRRPIASVLAKLQPDGVERRHSFLISRRPRLHHVSSCLDERKSAAGFAPRDSAGGSGVFVGGDDRGPAGVIGRSPRVVVQRVFLHLSVGLGTSLLDAAAAADLPGRAHAVVGAVAGVVALRFAHAVRDGGPWALVYHAVKPLAAALVFAVAVWCVWRNGRPPAVAPKPAEVSFAG